MGIDEADIVFSRNSPLWRGDNKKVSLRPQTLLDRRHMLTTSCSP